MHTGGKGEGICIFMQVGKCRGRKDVVRRWGCHKRARIGEHGASEKERVRQVWGLKKMGLGNLGLWDWAGGLHKNKIKINTDITNINRK